MSAQSAKDKPIKVLWLTSSYPRSKDDSASVFLRYLAEALANQKVSLHILSPDHPEVQATTQPDGIVCQHFRYFWPRKLQMLAYGSGILPNLRAAPCLFLQVPFFIMSMTVTAAWIMVVQRPSLIHAHWIFPQGTVAVLLSKLFRVSAIVTAHGGDAFALKGVFVGAIKRWTVKNCSAWTSNTSATSAAVGSDLPKPQIIPMGIDCKKFAGADCERTLMGNGPKKLVLLFVGRLVEKKGVADLLGAYVLLPEILRKQTELWIIGDGYERKKLESLARNIQHVNSIRFLGRIPNQQLPGYYAAADIFIAPSIIDIQGDTEGQGVMLLEAMASGLPIITTNVGGISSVIAHGETGLLVNPGKPIEIAAAIEKLLNDKNFRETLSIKACKAAQDYDWLTISSKFVNLYRESNSIRDK
ncbi:glycosyltransferase family 4 protein [Methylomonas sp. MO1]|uniref:glycosyltransferase family 4 protein n=1 Tax=unclassified Methylomonas TaxID=2608980 RepID=UPI00047B7BFE|nr:MULTISPECIES: glycosyltransferase family 4 protein [unclassified Methylomonas]MDT4291367.1 glycosyltransferase family 4 protein [Methylomonas sp. MO1]